MVLVVFMHLTRDLFSIAKFLLNYEQESRPKLVKLQCIIIGLRYHNNNTPCPIKLVHFYFMITMAVVYGGPLVPLKIFF